MVCAQGRHEDIPSRLFRPRTHTSPCIMKKIALVLAAAAFFGTLCSARGDSCSAVGIGTPRRGLVVFENEPFARIWLHRRGATRLVQTVDYHTVGGGEHNVARSGTAAFPVGQSATSVDVPLIDNGLLDGFKYFSLILTNPSPGLTITNPATELGLTNPATGLVHDSGRVEITIEDNELRSTVDPLFVPDVPFWFSPAVMPDGRVLMLGYSRLTMLQSNGWVDVDFARTLATSFSNAWLNPLQVLDDSRILAVAHYAGDSAQRLVRLLPSGAMDTVFTISNFMGLAAAQPDGKILVLTTNNNATLLRRLNTGGSVDTSFAPWSLGARAFHSSQVAFQPNGKLLVGPVYGTGTATLVRLNPDGSPDAFSLLRSMAFCSAATGRLSSSPTWVLLN